MTRGVLIDANVLIDLTRPVEEDDGWARSQVARTSDEGSARISPLIYAELAPGFPDAASLDRFLSPLEVRREPLPYAAAFPAMRAFIKYKAAGGIRTSCLPDFYIGAHAEVAGHALLTRDVARFRTYFPGVRLITPAD